MQNTVSSLTGGKTVRLYPKSRSRPSGRHPESEGLLKFSACIRPPLRNGFDLNDMHPQLKITVERWTRRPSPTGCWKKIVRYPRPVRNTPEDGTWRDGVKTRSFWAQNRDRGEWVESNLLSEEIVPANLFLLVLLFANWCASPSARF